MSRPQSVGVGRTNTRDTNVAFLHFNVQTVHSDPY